MKKQPICIDIDNVVAQTDAVLRELICRHTSGRVVLDYADVVEFEYWKCRDSKGDCITRDEWSIIHEAFSCADTIRAIRPMAGIEGHLRLLRDRYRLDFVTSRLTKAQSATEEWLVAHGVPFDRLIFTQHGSKHLLPERYAVVIEDHYEQAAAFAERGTKVLLLVHPWNRVKRRIPGIEWVESWKEMMRWLL